MLLLILLEIPLKWTVRLSLVKQSHRINGLSTQLFHGHWEQMYQEHLNAGI